MAIGCTICGSPNTIIHKQEFGVGEIVDCDRCGNYRTSHEAADYASLPFNDPKQAALASHVIRKMQAQGGRPKLTREFFDSLKNRSLPTPLEAGDELIVWFGRSADGRPGPEIRANYNDPMVIATIGVVEATDLHWQLSALLTRGAIQGQMLGNAFLGNLTAHGWGRFEEIQRARVSSAFAFFARKFSNLDLDIVFEKCLRPAVAATGYELRTVTQKAGLVDAVMEDEIRRCRFLIADLSDANAGAYWEAGFAEGLGKRVIYICAKGAKIHFDTDHRHTVKWDMQDFDETAKKLKAVIRNTLLGDAKQDD